MYLVSLIIINDARKSNECKISDNKDVSLYNERLVEAR